MSRASTTGRGRVWGGGFNRDVLESWVAHRACYERKRSGKGVDACTKVPQPSPCCAAASVAGAYNSLWHLDRDSAGACATLTAQFCRGGMHRGCQMLCRGTIREVANIMAENKQHVLCKQQQRIAPSPQIEPRLRSLGPPWASGGTPGRGRGKFRGLLCGLGRALGSQRLELDRKGDLGCDESRRASRNSTPGSSKTP